MATRLVVVCVCVLAAITPAAWASDAIDRSAPSGPRDVSATADTGDAALNGGGLPAFEPRIDVKMSDKNRDQLVTAIGVALERVHDVPECRGLFSELGADGVETLRKISFYPIGRHEANPNVCISAVAYTYVGGGPTWICRKFWRLPDQRAAMVVLHEALHHAGLTEQPRDPEGMTAAAISRMVTEQCGLGK
jgi:hypothetical protein